MPMMARAQRLGQAVRQSDLYVALAAHRPAVVGAAAISGVLNVLMLSGSMFMLLVYDSVLPSRSGASLVGLVVLVLLLYAFQGMLDVLRSRIMVQLGAAFDRALSGRVYELIMRPASASTGSDGLQALRDLDQVRGFISGQGLTALFDLPWIVIYLGLCFVFHWTIGLTALAGAVVLVALTLLTDRMSREPVSRTSGAAALRNGMLESNRQSFEVLRALGMRRRTADAWAEVNAHYRDALVRTLTVGGGMRSTTKILRIALQSIVLAVGAGLVLQGKASGGVIFASSFLTSRALAPVEVTIGDWKGVVAARQAWARLTEALAGLAPKTDPTPLPAPHRKLAVENLVVGPPGSPRATVQDVSFSLVAGDGLGIVGPSASGKSSLVKALVGAWTPVRGKVRLDGSALDQWDDVRLGQHIGYLPQSVELMAGTVAQNIARFDPQASAEDIIDAAQRAYVHDLILRLPEGYETRVGGRGEGLSAGQAQRIALARAFFGRPFLLVLDEPNSNLDVDGDMAFSEAVIEARRQGSIVILVAHRPSGLESANKVLVIADGRLQAFGPKEQILPQITGSSSPGTALRKGDGR